MIGQQHEVGECEGVLFRKSPHMRKYSLFHKAQILVWVKKTARHVKMI